MFAENPPQREKRTCDVAIACPLNLKLESGDYGTRSPVLGFRNNVPFVRILLKLNMPAIELATPSNDPWPMRCPFTQLFPMNRLIVVCSVPTRSTECGQPRDGIPSAGSLGPEPQ